MSPYEELVERVTSTKPYETGSIHTPLRSQWTVCDESGHIAFFGSPSEAQLACERMNTEAKLAEVFRTLETVTPEMLAPFAKVTKKMPRPTWLAMLSASPLAPPKDNGHA